MKHIILLAAGLMVASMVASATQTQPKDSFNKNTSTAGLSVPGFHFDDDHIPWPECYPCPEDAPPMPTPPPVPGCWPNCDRCYPNCVALTTEILSSSANAAELRGVMTMDITEVKLLPELSPVAELKDRLPVLRPSDASLRE